MSPSPSSMRVDLATGTALRLPDGRPVRAASAIAPFGDGFVIAQDDGTHGCLLGGDGSVSEVRLLPQIEGFETFSAAEGTKGLKPDLEAACVVPELDGSVLLLGSGSTPARRLGVLVRRDGTRRILRLEATYRAVAELLGVADDQLNIEGCCVVDGRLRIFQRGRPAAGLATASVDVALPDLDLVAGARTYDLGTAEGTSGPVGLGITEAVAVDGGVLVSATAEDTPDAYADGPVIASVLALLPHDGGASLVAALPAVEGRVVKVEGLAVVSWRETGGRLFAVVDSDDPAEASLLLTLDVLLG